ncbi:hypothetical protein LguiA_008157 [Lonicera macranthoides]
MAGNFPISQDWEAVVIRKKASTAAAPKDEKAVNTARRFGAEIETIQKSTTAIDISGGLTLEGGTPGAKIRSETLAKINVITYASGEGLKIRKYERE